MEEVEGCESRVLIIGVVETEGDNQGQHGMHSIQQQFHFQGPGVSHQSVQEHSWPEDQAG